MEERIAELERRIADLEERLQPGRITEVVASQMMRMLSHRETADFQAFQSDPIGDVPLASATARSLPQATG